MDTIMQSCNEAYVIDHFINRLKTKQYTYVQLSCIPTGLEFRIILVALVIWLNKTYEPRPFELIVPSAVGKARLKAVTPKLDVKVKIIQQRNKMFEGRLVVMITLDGEWLIHLF